MHYRTIIYSIFFLYNFLYISSINVPVDVENGDHLSKKKPISAEELLRRRKIFEKYLSDNYEDQSNWIDITSENYKLKNINDNSKNFHNVKLEDKKNKISDDLTFKKTFDKQNPVTEIEKNTKNFMNHDKYQVDYEINNSELTDNENNETKIKLNVGNSKVNETLAKDTADITPLNAKETFLEVEAKKSDVNNIFSDVKDKSIEMRRKILSSYKSEFKEAEGGWVETNSYMKKLYEKQNNCKYISASHLKSFNPNRTVVKRVESEFLDCARIKIYFNRWLKKLLSKLDLTDDLVITLSFSIESINNLKTLTSAKKFDITTADEIVSNLIFSAHINQSYNWQQYIPSYTTLSYTLSLIISVFVIYSIRNNLLLIIMLFLFIIILSAIGLNYYKMYQRKIAEKEHVLSSVSPVHCKTLLTPNSGIYDHIKESLRYSYHHAECKKYYDSLLVDSKYEINIILVISDLVWNSILQVFCVLADVLNYCVKAAFYDTFLYQKVIIVIIILFITLLWFRYKIKLPFITLEPSRYVGSGVENVSYNRNRIIDFLFFRNSQKFPLENTCKVNSEINSSVTQDEICDQSSKFDTMNIQNFEEPNNESRIKEPDKSVTKSKNISIEQLIDKSTSSKIIGNVASLEKLNAKNINSKKELIVEHSNYPNSSSEVTNLSTDFAKSGYFGMKKIIDVKCSNFITGAEATDICNSHIETEATLMSSGGNEVNDENEVHFETIKRKLDLLIDLVEVAALKNLDISEFDITKKNS